MDKFEIGETVKVFHPNGGFEGYGTIEEISSVVTNNDNVTFSDSLLIHFHNKRVDGWREATDCEKLPENYEEEMR